MNILLLLSYVAGNVWGVIMVMIKGVQFTM